ncbi:MAG TPA: hypothetical protein DCW90_17605 [Lachnospiraceae bacterium]|nr:hypothetical protein [Lachnospiraceae bacterium]
MRQRYTRFVCCILALIMAFTGMCMDAKQADSFLECSTLDSHIEASIFAHDDTITYEKLCTQRMLGISDLVFVNNFVKHHNIQTKSKSSLVSFVTTLCILIHISLQMAEENICVSKTHVKAIILNFIHEKDGKK